ncbi:MAG: hypothetical protein JW778_00910 [Candidatus Altiarchaeota archaeon]|nr:hypothetical protein [Candidatus Altiarchaeota archaeon]
MDLKDSALRFYVKGYIIPRALIFDKPGFVDFRISGKTEIFARQLILPESFFVKLEQNLIEKFGESAERMMYSLGKRFGYSFAQQGRFENTKDHPGDKVKNWIVVASKFVEGTYASNISQTIDVKKKIVDYTLKNFVVCRKLGYDFFFATGGAAGLIAWILQDPKIEGRLYDSKFNEEEHVCKVKCAPMEILKESFEDRLYVETNLGGLEQDPATYRDFNREVDIQWKKSFQTFLDAKIFNYAGGIISYKNERFFLMEVSGVYLLEKGMETEDMKKIMFDSAFSVGKEIFSDIGKNDVLSIMELLSALGWGEVSIYPSSKTKVIMTHFPWTKYYKDVEYILIRGLLSGIISRIYGKDIIYGKPGLDISTGHLSLIFEPN